MPRDAEAQRAAVELLWPEIGAYCLRRGVPRRRLLMGLAGVPVDGPKLLARCNEIALDRYDLAEQVGVRYDTIVKIVNGQRNPSAVVFSRLVRVLECDPSDLFLEDANG